MLHSFSAAIHARVAAAGFCTYFSIGTEPNACYNTCTYNVHNIPILYNIIMIYLPRPHFIVYRALMERIIFIPTNTLVSAAPPPCLFHSVRVVVIF